MAPSRINRFEHDRDDGVTIETGALTIELLPYSTWRDDGDELPDAGRDFPTCVIRLGRWVLCVNRR